MVRTAGEVMRAELDESKAGGTLLGKRYVSDDASLEVLCTHGGRGSLFAAETQLAMKESKKLPSSD